MTAGSSGRPDLKMLAQRYGDIKEQGSVEWVATQQAGAASTLISRMAGFQPGQQTGRHVARKRRAATLHAFAVRTSNMSVLQRCQAAVQMQSNAVASITAAIRFAVAAEKHTAAVKRRKLTKEKQLVEQFAGQIKDPSCQEVLHMLQLSDDKVAMVPLAPGVQCLRVKTHIAEHQAAGLCSLACNSKATNLGACLDEYWSRLHNPVIPPSADDAHNAAKPSLCRVVGVCLCSVEGKQQLKFRSALHRVMKSTLTLHPEQRKLLSDGFVVLCLATVPIKEPNESEERPFVAIEHWLHIGVQYFKPFRSTYLKLFKAPAIHPDYRIGVHDGDRVLLEVGGSSF